MHGRNDAAQGQFHDHFDDRICRTQRAGAWAIPGSGISVRSMARGWICGCGVPEWIDGLEALVRADLCTRTQARQCQPDAESVARQCRGRGYAADQSACLAAASCNALVAIEGAAMETGVTLAQASQADVLVMRGVMETGVDRRRHRPLARRIDGRSARADCGPCRHAGAARVRPLAA